jgi:hypothetical protein
VQDLARGIGSKCLHAGLGFDGPCFPKDTLGPARTARELGAPTSIAEAVAEAKAIAACGDSVADNTDPRATEQAKQASKRLLSKRLSLRRGRSRTRRDVGDNGKILDVFATSKHDAAGRRRTSLRVW